MGRSPIRKGPDPEKTVGTIEKGGGGGDKIHKLGKYIFSLGSRNQDDGANTLEQRIGRHIANIFRELSI